MYGYANLTLEFENEIDFIFSMIFLKIFHTHKLLHLISVLGGSCEKGFKQADQGCYGLTTETSNDGKDGSIVQALCEKLHEDAVVMPQAEYCTGQNNKIKERFDALQVLS